MAKLDKLRGLASRMLKQFAKPIVVKNIEEVLGPDGDVVQTVKASASVHGLVQSYDVRATNDFVNAHDLRIVVADQDLGFEPLVGQTVVEFDGTQRRVVAAEPLYSGELIATWALTVRV